MKELHIKGKSKLTRTEIRTLADTVCYLCSIDDMQVMLFASTDSDTYCRSLDYNGDPYEQIDMDGYTVIKRPVRRDVAVLWPIETFISEATPLVEGGAIFWAPPTDAQIAAAREILRGRIGKIL